MLRVFYYYYYLFYSRVLRDTEPHLLTTLVLSFSEASILIYAIDLIGVHLLCRFLLGKWEMIAINVALVGLNYLVYHRTGKAREIVKTKPKFFGSHRFSLIATLLFFIASTSLLFWMADYLLFVMKNKC